MAEQEGRVQAFRETLFQDGLGRENHGKTTKIGCVIENKKEEKEELGLDIIVEEHRQHCRVMHGKWPIS